MFRKFLLPMVLVLALSLPVAGAENPLSKLTEGENLEGICVMGRAGKRHVAAGEPGHSLRRHSHGSPGGFPGPSCQSRRRPTRWGVFRIFPYMRIPWDRRRP